MKAELPPAIRDWLEAEKEVEAARAKADRARSIAHSIPLPSNLRPAVEEDIVQGAVIWYPASETSQPFPMWALVRTVVRENGEFKGYVSHHPVRLDLGNAFVEVADVH
jgi:hypothetical protein